MKLLDRLADKISSLRLREKILGVILLWVMAFGFGYKVTEYVISPADYDETAVNVTEEYKDIMYKSSYKIVTKAKLKINRWGWDQIVDVEGSGTGTVIKNDHGRLYLMTCDHVLDFSKNGKHVTVEVLEASHYMEYHGQLLPLQIEFSDKLYDIALVKTEMAVSNYSGTVVNKFATAKDMRPGDVVYVVGYPGGLERSMTRGIIAAMEHKFTFELVPKNVFLGNVSITGGNSGGGLFVLEDGEPMLAGMSQFGLGLNGVYGYNLINRIKQCFKNYDYGYMLD